MTAAQKSVLASLGMLVAYAAAIGTIGFFVATSAYLVAHMLYLGVRDPRRIVLVTLGTVAVFWVAVEWFLQVSLPEGILL